MELVFWLIAQFVGLSIIIVIAGTLMATYAEVVGRQTRLGGGMAGLLLLAMATSLPELATDCAAALVPAPDVAVGGVIGSCLFNLLILAGLDLLRRDSDPILSRKRAAQSLAGTTTIMLMAIVIVGLMLPASWSLARLGPTTPLIAVAYLFTVRLIYLDSRTATGDRARSEGDREMSTRHAVIGYLVTAFAVLATAPFLAFVADDIAQSTGLGGTFVGTLFVGIATSLPEISTTRAAVRMGAFDMAISNIFGSNTFNLLILLPVDLCYGGSILAVVSPAHIVTAGATILATGIAMTGLLYRAEKRRFGIEIDAILMAAVILSAFALTYVIRE